MAAAPKLLKIDPQMQRWCATLEAEIATWPEVSSRGMFGMQAFYRGTHIFAALPRTRAPETPFSFLIKHVTAVDRRIRGRRSPGAAWATFTMECDADLAVALEHLSRAYQKAGRTSRRRR